MRLKLLLAVAVCVLPLALKAETVQLSDEVMLDKIKGGWVGQVVGCTYGGPTEFRWNGTWIQDYVTLRWDGNMMYEAYTEHPGLLRRYLHGPGVYGRTRRPGDRRQRE